MGIVFKKLSSGSSKYLHIIQFDYSIGGFSNNPTLEIINNSSNDLTIDDIVNYLNSNGFTSESNLLPIKNNYFFSCNSDSNKQLIFHRTAGMFTMDNLLYYKFNKLTVGITDGAFTTSGDSNKYTFRSISKQTTIAI